MPKHQQRVKKQEIETSPAAVVVIAVVMVAVMRGSVVILAPGIATRHPAALGLAATAVVVAIAAVASGRPVVPVAAHTLHRRRHVLGARGTVAVAAPAAPAAVVPVIRTASLPGRPYGGFIGCLYVWGFIRCQRGLIFSY